MLGGILGAALLIGLFLEIWDSVEPAEIAAPVASHPIATLAPQPTQQPRARVVESAPLPTATLQPTAVVIQPQLDVVVDCWSFYPNDLQRFTECRFGPIPADCVLLVQNAFVGGPPLFDANYVRQVTGMSPAYNGPVPDGRAGTQADPHSSVWYSNCHLLLPQN